MKFVFLLSLLTVALPAAAEVALDGHSLTPALLARIADGEPIHVEADALERVEEGHRRLLDAAVHGQPIYGLTVGVGLNKDRKMVDMTDGLSVEDREQSERFNIGVMRAHAGGIGPDMPVRIARAAMAARLNGMLLGASGVQPAVVDGYIQFLNRGITPVMPSDSSVGEADITILSHVGLALLGEGEVTVRGKKMPAADALRAAKLQPIRPWGKDALAILSSNAYSAGMAGLALNDLARLVKLWRLVYAHSLQAFDGNVSPLREDTLALRPFPETVKTGAALRKLLDGSSLWQPSAGRRLQDPLSFRDGVYLLGELDRTLAQAGALLQIQLNSSDDNPGVSLAAGRVLPSANFEPLPWVLAFEEIGLALAHSSLASAERVSRLDDERMTGLSRNLGPDQIAHAFGTMEKPAMVLAEANRDLANPVSMNFMPVTGGVEDIATNAPQVVERVQRQIDNSISLLGVELIHAAQAVDLRTRKDPAFVLSPACAYLYAALRKRVPFLDQDRSMTPDFRAAEAVLRGYPLTEADD